MTREQIAAKVGCDTSSITKYYNGDRYPKTDIIIKLAELFNISTDYLLGITEIETALKTDGNSALRISCDYTGLNENSINRIRTNKYENILFSDLSAVDYIDDKYDNEQLQNQYEYDYIDNSPILSRFKENYSDILNNFLSSDCFFEILNNVMSIFLTCKIYDELLKIGNGNFEIFENCKDVAEIRILLHLLENFNLSDYKKVQKISIYECQENITSFCKNYISKTDDFLNLKCILKSSNILQHVTLSNVMYNKQLESKKDYLDALKEEYSNNIFLAKNDEIENNE